MLLCRSLSWESRYFGNRGIMTRETKSYIDKPWGWEKLWAHTDKYVGKILHIKDGQQLSRQYHEKKEETIYVIRGVLTLIIEELQDVDDKMPNEQLVKIKQKLGPGEYYHIKPGVVHRFCAENGDVVLAEVSTYFPDDVVRIEDDYNR